MTERADVIEVRRRLNDPRAVVAALGLDGGARRQPNGVSICCPWHVEVHPSCSVTLRSDGTIGVVCFACGQRGDVLTLVAIAFGLDIRSDFPRVLEEAAHLAGYEPQPRRRWGRTG